jgi:hypothetical protein
VIHLPLRCCRNDRGIADVDAVGAFQEGARQVLIAVDAPHQPEHE